MHVANIKRYDVEPRHVRNDYDRKNKKKEITAAQGTKVYERTTWCNTGQTDYKSYVHEKGLRPVFIVGSYI